MSGQEYPKLSVSLVCFQQVGYIRQAVESVLSQKTDFPVEIIIGDDASTDGTRDVLHAIAAQYPRQVRLLLPHSNYGDRGLSNFMATVDAARGEYIAFLDGDDYWTDREKLQRQVDFLERHTHCALCAHPVLHVFEDGSRQRSPEPPGSGEVHDVGQLVVENFAHKISTVVRRRIAGQIPGWYRSTALISADWLFNVCAGRFGEVGYIDRVMAVHRQHSGSLTAYYGADRMLADKLKSLDMLSAFFPEHKQAFEYAKRRVRWKRRVARLGPRTYRLFQRLYSNPRLR